MQQRTWKRRNYFVNKDFQGKFILRFFLAILIGAIIFTFIFGVFSSHTITISYKDSFLRLDKTPKALFVEIVRSYGVYIFLLGLTISVMSLFLSHRIAGPIYRLEKSVEEITNGNLSFKIILRQNDEAKELAIKMNAMIDILSGHLKDIKSDAEDAYSRVNILSKRLESENLKDAAIRQDISDAVQKMESLKESLSFFKTSKA